MKPLTHKKQLDEFIAKYSPVIAKLGKSLLAKMRKRLPEANVLVYDNYNALAIGFCPTEKTSDTVISLAFYPRWISLFFFQGAKFPDPSKRLKGNGSQIRHIVLESVEMLEEPEIEAFIAMAVERSKEPFVAMKGKLIIKSISETQKPRRPKK